MREVLLKDYEGEYVTLYDSVGDMFIVEKDDYEFIKEASDNGTVIYGAKVKGLILDDCFLNEALVDFISDYYCAETGEDGIDNLDFESESFKKAIGSLGNWIESLGDYNKLYETDEDIKIIV